MVVLICLELLRLCRDERSKVIEEERKAQRISVAKKRTGNTEDFFDSESNREDFDIRLSKSTLKSQMARSHDNEFEIAEGPSGRLEYSHV